MIIEVADTSLRFDTTVKMGLYTARGIAEYLVIDVNNRLLLVFRDPAPDASQHHGYSYATQLTFSENDAVTPLAVPGASVKVADLLP